MGQIKKRELKIVSEKVINRQGEEIGTRPEDFPELANRIKAVSETIRTGNDYRVVHEGGGVA